MESVARDISRPKRRREKWPCVRQFIASPDLRLENAYGPSLFSPAQSCFLSPRLRWSRPASGLVARSTIPRGWMRRHELAPRPIRHTPAAWKSPATKRGAISRSGSSHIVAGPRTTLPRECFGTFSLLIPRRKSWLGRRDSNLRMVESKSRRRAKESTPVLNSTLNFSAIDLDQGVRSGGSQRVREPF